MRLLFLLALPNVLHSADYKCSTNNGTLTITDYTGSGGSVTIPSRISGLPVTGVGDCAFAFCDNLTSITIPNSITSIGAYAFDCCCGLTTVTIPDSVTNLGDCTFQYCTSLINVTIGNAITSVTRYEFDGCTSLTTVTIPLNVNSIGDYAFRSCTGLTNITMGTSVTNIGSFAFGFCSGLASVAIPGSLASIGDSTFYHCTNLFNVMIGNGIRCIGPHAFDGCTSLRSLMVPISVTSIGDYAFSYCSSLTALYFKGDAPLVDSTAFAADNNVSVYYWPGGCGWGCTYGGCPTMLWNLQAQTCDASVGGFTITGPSNLVVVVEACTNLANPVWCPLQTIYLSGGAVRFSDPQLRNYPRRFYRLRTP